VALGNKDAVSLKALAIHVDLAEEVSGFKQVLPCLILVGVDMPYTL
jgi:hypothetical protein